MASTADSDSVRILGLTVLFEPKESDPIADIVFVHGLQGNAMGTWTPKSTDSKRANLTKIGQKASSKRGIFRSKEGSSKTSTPKSTNDHEPPPFWPYHFLHDDCKKVRILTWGYNSKVSEFFHGSANKGTIFSHARGLLGDLTGERLPCPKRPLIFVAHSLGGIIVKAMLLRASESETERERNVYNSTKAILFLGTPHRGGNYAAYGEIARRAASAIGYDTNSKNISDLAIDSHVLEDIQERFLKLYRRKKIEILTFQEARGMKGTSLLGLNEKVVDDFSSAFNGEDNRFSIDANHVEMCRYWSKEDDGYRQISRELRILCDDIERSIEEEDVAGRVTSAQSGRANSDPLLESQSLVTEQFERLGLLEQLMPDTSIFGDLADQFLLYEAIKAGDEPTTRKLLKMGTRIDGEGSLSKPDISLAVRSGNVGVVALLLDYGADIEKKAPYSMETPLVEATRLRHQAIAKLLLQRGADSQSMDVKGKSSLHIACEGGDDGLVVLLLEHRRASIEQKCSKSMDTPLHLATISGQTTIVDLLIQWGANIEAPNSEGETPLHLASALCDDKIAKLLLKGGAETETKETSMRRTPLHYAAEKGNLAVARALLSSKAHTNTCDGQSGMTALHLAAEHGHADIVSLLISYGAAVNPPLHISRATPLHLASANGHDSVVEILIKERADVAAIQYPNLTGETSLHLAAQNGHHLVVRLLCFKSILEQREMFGGNTPLHLATLRGHTLAAKILLENNAEVEARNNQGLTALYLALREGNEEVALLLLNEGGSTKWPVPSISPIQYASLVGQISVVQKLVKLGADVQDAGVHGEPALTCAAAAGHTAIVSLLLSKQANLDSQNGIRRTALHQASLNGHSDTVRLLLNCGADVKLIDSDGRTALHHAASRGHEDVVRILIKNGADCTATDGNQLTPLHLAAASGYDKLVFLLHTNGAVVDALSERRTPLAFACNNGHWTTAKVLLDMGAQVAGSEFIPPLIGAAKGNYLEIIDLLQSRRGVNDSIGDLEAMFAAAYFGHALAIKKLRRWEGLDINATGPEGASALHFAAVNGDDSAIQALLDEGADVDHRCNMDWLPIHRAGLNGHVSAIRLLLNAGSGIKGLQDIIDEDLLRLRRLDQESLVQLFVQFARATKRFYATIKDGDIASLREQITNKATIKMKDGSGNTALHAAIEYNRTEAIPILCDAGIDVNAKNIYGRTASHEAVLRGNVEAQRLLLQHGSDVI